MTQQPTPHKPSRPTPEQLADLYPTPLTHDERTIQTAESQARREARLPQHLAIRASALLTAVPLTIVGSVHFINTILQLAGVLSAVCFSFLIIVALGYYIIASVSEINGYFMRRDQPTGPFWTRYSIIATILILLIAAVYPLSVLSLLAAPWYGVSGVILLHAGIAYGLAGRWLGWK